MDGKILYEDKHMILCVKPAGVPSQPDPSGQDDLLSYLQQQTPSVRPSVLLSTGPDLQQP